MTVAKLHIDFRKPISQTEWPVIEPVIQVPGRFAAYYGGKTQSESFRHTLKHIKRSEEVFRLSLAVEHHTKSSSHEARHLDPEIDSANAQLIVRDGLERMLEIMGIHFEPRDATGRRMNIGDKDPYTRLADAVTYEPWRLANLWECGKWPNLKLLILPMHNPMLPKTLQHRPAVRSAVFWHVGVIRSKDDIERMTILQAPQEKVRIHMP